MRRRILSSVLTVTIVAVVLFGLPLAIAVRKQYLAEATLRLERAATTAAREVPGGIASAADPVELPRSSNRVRFGLYRADGSRVAGDGPEQGDAPVSDAADNTIQDIEQAGRLVVAVPISADEKVVAVLRADQPLSEVDHRVWRAWAAMAALAAVAIGLAALLARRQASRLTKPVVSIRDAAQQLGHGDFSVHPEPSGIAELDDAGAALAATAGRLGRMVGRERDFSAHASHQLRTPLTGLRLLLETELTDPQPTSTRVIDDALAEVDRLEATITELLSLARDEPVDRGSLDLAALLGETEQRWHGILAAAGRPLRVEIDPGLPRPHAAPAALAQVLDVLVDNAHRYGAGTVTVDAHAVDRGVGVRVTDEGEGITTGAEQLFERGTSTDVGHGIGLALARSLTEAEGGRLLLERAGPHPSFLVILPA